PGTPHTPLPRHDGDDPRAILARGNAACAVGLSTERAEHRRRDVEALLIAKCVAKRIAASRELAPGVARALAAPAGRLVGHGVPRCPLQPGLPTTYATQARVPTATRPRRAPPCGVSAGFRCRVAFRGSADHRGVHRSGPPQATSPPR